MYLVDFECDLFFFVGPHFLGATDDRNKVHVFFIGASSAGASHKVTRNAGDIVVGRPQSIAPTSPAKRIVHLPNMLEQHLPGMSCSALAFIRPNPSLAQFAQQYSAQ